LTGGEYDIAHSPHPLLMPSRSAAQIVTIHDLHFLSHPERTSKEVRRDYPALAATHARRADRVIVSSRFGASEVQRLLHVESQKISICRAGAPEWKSPPANVDGNGYILFMGTLDERKNLGGLLDAYARLLSMNRSAPRLVVAGNAGPEAAKWLDRLRQAPLAGRAEYIGYVRPDDREGVFKGAQLFVLPSFEEGFGLPALEAMAAGVPVVASNRGSLPEVIGDAGLLIDPDSPDSLSDAMQRMLGDPALRVTCAHRGLDRAREFNWAQTGRDVRRAYQDTLTQTLDAHRH
jgi:alpha-1,3-rhamnosyl/mannosyltransferase